MKKALLLIAHGSREPEANDDLRHVADKMRRRGEFDFVEASFLELATPNISDGAARCVELGAERVVMLPYFLSPGVHVRRDLASFKDELAKRFPAVDFKLAQPLGRHELLVDVVAARAREGSGQWTVDGGQ